MYKLVVPLGILTYLSVILTFLIAKRVIKVKFKFHKMFGAITVILATLHALLVIYLQYF